MTQNVVTYTVEVNTDNSDGKLIPYLTANLKFMVAERKDVLMVPNAALRWIPQPDQIAAEVSPGAPRKRRVGGPEPRGRLPAKGQKDPGPRGRCGSPRAPTSGRFRCSLGLTDGSLTEVQSPELKEGIQVVVGEQTARRAAPRLVRQSLHPANFPEERLRADGK